MKAGTPFWVEPPQGGGSTTVRVLKIEELRGNKTSMNLIFNVCFSVAQLQVKFVPKTWVTTSCARVVDGVQGPLFQSMYFGKPLQRAILWTA